MTSAKLALIGIAALASGAALAQQNLGGTVTMIDRPDHNIVIQQPQSGTVGSSVSPTEWLKVQSDLSLDNVHVGDKVNFTVNNSGGAKTVTKLEKQPVQ